MRSIKLFFRQLLSKWKNDLIDQNNRIIFGNSDDNASSADIVDQATSYSGKTVEMRTVNRNKKLINKIDDSLKKLMKELMVIVKKQEKKLV